MRERDRGYVTRGDECISCNQNCCGRLSETNKDKEQVCAAYGAPARGNNNFVDRHSLPSEMRVCITLNTTPSSEVEAEAKS